ncbi:MAG: hypothetical protein ACHQRM_13720 [Bacteroidia bacterium]
MIHITSANCEQIFIKYYENRLTSRDIDALLKFLIAHPEMEETFVRMGKAEDSLVRHIHKIKLQEKEVRMAVKNRLPIHLLILPVSRKN